MKNLLLISSVLFMASIAQAIFLPGIERPIMYNDNMEICDANSEFIDVERVSLILNRRDDNEYPTSISLKLLWDDGELETRKLTIVDIQKESCGTIKYVAQGKKSEEERYFVTLQDHSFSRCKVEDSYIWEATVTVGPDEEDARDREMFLSGNPDFTYTIF